MDYVQPDFYRFNEDSLKLVTRVESTLSKASHVLDVGAGCGIIGIELALRINIGELHLLEVQQDFLPFIETNLNSFVPQQKCVVTISSFSQFHAPHKFELILCNPPYYLPGRGQSNKNLKRGICRSFQIDSWTDLLTLFEESLAPSGKAWVVIKNDKTILELIEYELKGRGLSVVFEESSDLVFVSFYLDV